MMPSRTELWAFATELETIYCTLFLLLAPQLVLAAWFGGMGNAENYGTWMMLVLLASFVAYLGLIFTGALRQRGTIRTLALHGIPIVAVARTVPTILDTYMQYLANFAAVICEGEDDTSLKIEIPVRDWALRGGAIKPGQKLLFIADRDRNRAVMFRPEYLAYLDTHSRERFQRLLEGTRNERLSSEVINRWTDIRRTDQASAS